MIAKALLIITITSASVFWNLKGMEGREIESSQPTLLEQILNDPKTLLLSCDAIRAQCDKELEEHSDWCHEKDLKTYKSIIQKWERRNPLFALYECTEQGKTPCCLNRIIYPHFRDTFEKRVSSLLNEKIGAKKGPVAYVAFGDGGSLQDAIIVINALNKNPEASLEFHAIDPKNTGYAQALRLLKSDQTVTCESSMSNFKSIQKKMAMYAQKCGLAGNLNNAKLSIKLTTDFVAIETKYRQLISFIRTTFPKAHFTLKVYSDYKNFLSHLGKTKSIVIAAADIEDDASLGNNAPADLMKLCEKVSKSDPDAYCLWLSSFKHGSANLTTLWHPADNDFLKNAVLVNNKYGLYVSTEEL